MKRRSALPLMAAGATVLLALAACSGSKPSPRQTSGEYNAALNAAVNASSHKGETIVFDYSTVPDSTDPGNTYHAEIWNLLRLYGRALVTYKSAPGAAGMGLVPDLATSLGKVSDNGLTWTYHLKPGIRYETGATVTSQDVKYAIERSYARYLLPNGRTQRPRGQRHVHQGADHYQHRRQNPDLVPNRPASHGGRGHPPGRLRQGAALPEPAPDQRLRAPVLLHVRLRQPRPQIGVHHRCGTTGSVMQAWL